jgi:hypothetical protein
MDKIVLAYAYLDPYSYSALIHPKSSYTPWLYSWHTLKALFYNKWHPRIDCRNKLFFI